MANFPASVIAALASWRTVDWEKWREKTERHWVTLLAAVLEDAREGLADSEVGSPAAAKAQRRLEKMLEETKGNLAYRNVIAAIKAVLDDIALAKGFHAARKLAAVTASMLVRVRHLQEGETQLDKAAASIEMRDLIGTLDLAQKVLERLKTMKEAAFGDDPNLGVFLAAGEDLIAELKK